MKTLRKIALTMLAVYFVAPIYAYQSQWEELNAKVVQLYQQGRYAEATKVAQQALKVAEKTFGPEHPKVATSLKDLGILYDSQGKYAEAEPLYKRALAIREKGPWARTS